MKNKKNKLFTPEFFDIFGFIAFLFLIFVGFKMIGNSVLDWTGYVVLFIGIFGALVDGIIVLKNFILGK